MKLYTTGCSFTWNDKKGWANILAEKLGVDIVNLANPGAGNTYINHSIQLNDNKIIPDHDLVIIMWSGLTRKDVLIDRTDKLLKEALDGYMCNFMCGNNTNYIFSGGIVGSWMDTMPITREIFEPLYKISSELTMATETLLNIISLQNYLKNKKIPYIMSSYVNYWTDEISVCHLDFGIGRFKELDHLMRQIDFTPWAFINDKKDGIYELGKSIPSGLDTDKFHPSITTHELWADILMEKIKKDNYLVKENQ
jgi:hypothetical protein